MSKEQPTKAELASALTLAKMRIHQLECRVKHNEGVFIGFWLIAFAAGFFLALLVTK